MGNWTYQGETWVGKRPGVAEAETRVSEGVDGVLTFDITVTELQTPSL